MDSWVGTSMNGSAHGLSRQFPVVERLTGGRDDGRAQAAGFLQLVEQLAAQFFALYLEGRHIDQVVPLERIGLQIIETVAVPDAVHVEIHPAFRADGEDRRRRGKV